MTQETSQNTEKTQPSDERLERWKAKHEYLSAIDIRDTLAMLGANGNQDNDKTKWKIEGVGNIITKKQQWFNGNQHIPGYGSVSLVRHALGLEKDTDAMNWLIENFPEYAKNWSYSSLGAEKSQQNKEDEDEESSFTPPELVPAGIEAVRDYLVGVRHIPQLLVDREIAEGRIYATQKKDEESRRYYGEYQCVFIGPSSAEIRSTDPEGFKGCCTGSDSDKSSYQVMFCEPHENVIAMTEAAVDALSYHALHPHQFTVSTNGAGRFAYQYSVVLEGWRNGFQSKWAFDADESGDLAAQRLFNALFLREALAEKWGVEADDVDRWFVNGDISSIPDPSPHMMFLEAALLGETNHTVREFFKVEKEDPANPKKKKISHEWQDTDKKSEATIAVKVNKKLPTVARGTKESFHVGPAQVKDLLTRYQAERSRPAAAKDWNEVWARKGLNGSKEYNLAAKKQFETDAIKTSAENNQEANNPTPVVNKNRFNRQASRS